MAESTQERIQSFAFVISIFLCLALSGAVVRSGFTRSEQPRKIELDDKINPNGAPAASLVRLPGIGLARAQAIVAYRKGLRERDANDPAFRDCDDLQHVKGIGPKIVENMRPWLKFE